MPVLSSVATVSAPIADVSDPSEDYGKSARYLYLHLRKMAQNVDGNWQWRGTMIDAVRLLWPTVSNDDARNVTSHLVKKLKSENHLEMIAKGGPSNDYMSLWRISDQWTGEVINLPKETETRNDGKRPQLVYSKRRITVQAKCGHSWITSAKPGSVLICPICNARGKTVRLAI
jgi:hypothetical protein